MNQLIKLVTVKLWLPILVAILLLNTLIGLMQTQFGVETAWAAAGSGASLAPNTDVCFVSLNNSGTTDYSSADGAAVQTAVNAAIADDTLKIAGTCAGVNSQGPGSDTQTVYIDKSLTLIGGYDETNWAATPDPDTHPTTLDAEANGRVIRTSETSNLTLTNLTIINGDFWNVGGGIYSEGNLTVTHSIVSNNHSSTEAGGICAAGFGKTFSLQNSVIQNNLSDSASIGGGGLYLYGDINSQIISSTIRNNQALTGGGVFDTGTNTTIENSAIYSNTATSGNGGGIYNRYGTLTIRNSTISQNAGSGLTNAHVNGALVTLTISYTTIVSNSAEGLLLTASNPARNTAVVGSSIIANNSTDCANPDSATLDVTTGYNLDSDGSCVTSGTDSNITSATPGLEPLQDNGGNTWTHALLANSPALDAIPYGLNGCGTTYTTDQRGQPRPVVTNCDAGAYESALGQDAACFVETTDDNVTDFSSGNASAVQTAVNAATAGDLLKIAGTCAGVNSQGPGADTQTVYIDKDLTLIGGYDETDWTLPPDSDTNPTTLDAEANGRVVRISTTTNVTLTNLTITNGDFSDVGGGIYAEGNLTVTHTVVSNNHSDSEAGGIYAAGSIFTLQDSVIRNNASDAASNGGGGLYLKSTITNAQIISSTITNNQALTGGGLYDEGTKTIIENSAIYSNTATSGSGGGIYNWNSTGDMTIRNSTISQNTGSGLTNAHVSGAPVTAVVISYTTIVSNSAEGLLLTAFNPALNTASLASSIIANNGADCANPNGATLDATPGYNLDSDGSCIVGGGTGNITNATPGLAALGEYGSPISGSGQSLWTHALLPGSPAIDQIPDGTNDCGGAVATDQRGVARAQLAGCDIGAYESRGFTLQVTGGDDQITDVGTAFPQPLAVALTSFASEEPDGVGREVIFSAPGSGASLNPSVMTETVSASNSATSMATANSVSGSYVVEANIAGAVAPAFFTLRNLETFNVACSTAALITALEATAVPTGTIEFDLAADCDYVLTAVYDTDPDGYGPIGLPPVRGIAIINGNGATITRDAATDPFRLFYVADGGDLTLNQITLNNGYAQGGDGARPHTLGGGGGGAAGLGGAIFNMGELIIRQSTLLNNQAMGGNGASNAAGGNAAAGGGGGMGGDGQGRNGGGINGGDNDRDNVHGGEGGGGYGGSRIAGNGGHGGFGGAGGGGNGQGSLKGGRRGGYGGFGGGGGGGGSIPTGSATGLGRDGGFAGGNGGNGNIPNSGAGGGGGGLGGAVFNYGGTVTLENSTLVSNTVQGGVRGDGNGGTNGESYGGSLFNHSGTMTLLYTTVAANQVQNSGGGIYNYTGATLHLTGTIIADSVGSTIDCVNDGGTIILSNTIIESHTSCGAPLTVDPSLDVLADNGGQTETMALLSGSPAIDAVAVANCAAGVDQRGVERPQGTDCDIGAFEFSLAANAVCFVEATEDNATDFSTVDGTALQTAVDAADPNDLIKVAGTCAGVQIQGNLTQTVYITKNLTIQGGYTTTNWLVSDPDTYPTTLDAQSLGRVIVISGTANVQVENLTATGGQAIDGGGIFIDTAASLTLNNSQVLSNTTTIGGGLFDSGGGLGNLGNTVISGTLFSNNHSVEFAGGVGNGSTGKMTIEESTFSYNSASNAGGALGNTGWVTVTNSSFISNTGHGSGAIGNLQGLSGPGWMLVQNSDFFTNTAVVNGGAIDNDGGELHLIGSTFIGNSGKSGGALYNNSAVSSFNPTLYITSSTFLSNTTTNGDGGVLRNREGATTISGSTFSYNTASESGGAIQAQNGSVNISNSTFSYNTAAAQGGGLYSVKPGTAVTLTHSTVTSNTAPSGAGVFIENNTFLTVMNSILSGNFGANDCDSMTATLQSGGYNLLGTGCTFATGSDITTTTLGLAPLADNGGDTWTHALLSNSPAIDLVPASACVVAPTDQRGTVRPQGVHCDSGAFEYVGVGTAVSPTMTISYTTPPTAMLNWSDDSANCVFDVYSSTVPYAGYSLLVSGLTGLSYEDTAGTVGNLGTNTFYYVDAYACGGLDTAVSNQVGEFDFAIVPGS